MNTTARSLSMPPLPALLLALAVVLTAAACAAVAGPSGQPSTTPAQPTASPSVPASPSVAPSPTASASEQPGSDAMPIKVDLANVGNHNVYIDVVDRSGKVVSGSSGRPGDGASIPERVVKIENIDSKTLRLTWSGIVGDNALALYIDETATKFVLVQPEVDGDTFPVDRILILKFSQDIPASGINAVVQNDTDQPG
jgi:hypothetical protein